MAPPPPKPPVWLDFPPPLRFIHAFIGANLHLFGGVGDLFQLGRHLVDPCLSPLQLFAQRSLLIFERQGLLKFVNKDENKGERGKLHCL